MIQHYWLYRGAEVVNAYENIDDNVEEGSRSTTPVDGGGVVNEGVNEDE